MIGIIHTRQQCSNKSNPINIDIRPNLGTKSTGFSKPQSATSGSLSVESEDSEVIWATGYYGYHDWLVVWNILYFSIYWE